MKKKVKNSDWQIGDALLHRADGRVVILIEIPRKCDSYFITKALDKLSYETNFVILTTFICHKKDVLESDWQIIEANTND